jgi:WD40 repeat protein
VRLTNSGAFDPNFGSGDGIVEIDLNHFQTNLNALVIQPDGKIILGGNTRKTASDEYHSIRLRLNADGTPDFTNQQGYLEMSISTNGDFVYDLALQPDGKLLCVGVAGIGDYNQIFLTRSLTGLIVSAAETPAPLSALQLSPNPLHSSAQISYTLREARQLSICLFDAAGRVVASVLDNEARNEGQHTETLTRPSGLPMGTYWLQLRTERHQQCIPVLIF